ncbi:hypothetical protein LWI28_016320 [Acer negundo]|uniref:Uncharacterized protein n=1 Tax=Acer negundo TaxID=4023 RepID=A0AAD5IQM7_ACENE|nr:hypothetical protein LWI28_016320 [Acer negundo]
MLKVFDNSGKLETSSHFAMPGSGLGKEGSGRRVSHRSLQQEPRLQWTPQNRDARACSRICNQFFCHSCTCLSPPHPFSGRSSLHLLAEDNRGG